MRHRISFGSFAVWCAVLAGVGLLSASMILQAQMGRRGRNYKPPPPTARIAVTVIKADDGAPISDAHVIFHPIEHGKDTGSLELKTNENGKAVIDVIPIGDTVILQVIAHGFQTYGQKYKIAESSMSMEVRLNRPVPGVSIYKNNSGAKSGNGAGNSGGQQKK